MSIKLMSLIWDRSKQSGTSLLLLLAIADYANDDGLAWPSLRSLADRIRKSERYTQLLLSKLVASKELVIDERRGGNHSQTNLYRIDRAKLGRVKRASSVTGEARLTPGRVRPASRRVRPASRRVRRASSTGEAGLTQTTINHQEPSLTTTAAAAAEGAAPPGPAAAAAVVENTWRLEGLLEVNGVSAKRRAELAGASPIAFVAKYLYALSHGSFNNPPLYAAKHLSSPTGSPWRELAQLTPRDLAGILHWLMRGASAVLNLNGELPLALALRGFLSSTKDSEARVIRAIYELGLADLVAAIDEETAPQEPSAPEHAPALLPDVWQQIAASIVRETPSARTQFSLTRLKAQRDNVLIVAVPHQGVADWINNRLGKRLDVELAKVAPGAAIQWEVAHA